MVLNTSAPQKINHDHKRGIVLVTAIEIKARWTPNEVYQGHKGIQRHYANRVDVYKISFIELGSGWLSNPYMETIRR